LFCIDDTQSIPFQFSHIPFPFSIHQIVWNYFVGATVGALSVLGVISLFGIYFEKEDSPPDRSARTRRVIERGEREQKEKERKENAERKERKENAERLYREQEQFLFEANNENNAVVCEEA
jgi:hypothetical protein